MCELQRIWPSDDCSTSLAQSRLTTPIFVLICTVWFSLYMVLCAVTKHLHFCVFCWKDTVPDVLQFIQMQFCRLKLWFHVFVPCMLVKCFSCCRVNCEHLRLWHTNWACQSLRCSSWLLFIYLFQFLLALYSLTLGVHLLGCPLLPVFWMLLHLGIIFPTVNKQSFL